MNKPIISPSESVVMSSPPQQTIQLTSRPGLARPIVMVQVVRPTSSGIGAPIMPEGFTTTTGFMAPN